MAALNRAAGGGILVVEDDPGTWRLEEECLAGLGLPLRRAASAAEAEAALRALTPDLLVADYSLPGATAPELLARLRAEGVPVPPCLLISGCPDDELAAQAASCGAAGFLVKDGEFLGNLLSAVKRALAAGARR